MKRLIRGERSRLRRSIATTAVLITATATVLAVANQAAAAPGCVVSYAVNQWPGGFTAQLVVTNHGAATTSWALEWDYADATQRVGQAWNAVAAQTGRHVTLRNAAWNGALGTGASVNPGFTGSWSSGNPTPTAFTLNGVPCQGTPGSSAPSSSAPGSSSPPSTPPSTPPSSSAAPPTRESHVDNPYVGVAGYVNPRWRALAESVPGGGRVSGNPTGLWVDSVAHLAGTPDNPGLRAHLDAAVAQGAGYVQVVVNNLPGRNCDRVSTVGDFGAEDLARYRSEFIDPIAAIEADPAYGRLRIVNVLELNSLPLLVTSLTPSGRCLPVVQSGAYTAGLRYALDALHRAGSNVYTYLDVANHGWFGWENNFAAVAALYADLARGTSAGLAGVDGFITNAAGYAPLTEPHFTIASTVSGVPVRQSRWVDWNSYVDDLPYAQALRVKLVSLGFSSGIGMLIDTSRNGWGGPARPTGPSGSVDLNTFVDESRVDRRLHPGNWCNQAGAGLGERPVAAPAAGIDAYVWIKPPGESDGATVVGGDPLLFEPMCDPAAVGDDRNGHNLTGALPAAPAFGAWFPTQFTQLMANAFPPLP